MLCINDRYGTCFIEQSAMSTNVSLIQQDLRKQIILILKRKYVVAKLYDYNERCVRQCLIIQSG